MTSCNPAATARRRVSRRRSVLDDASRRTLLKLMGAPRWVWRDSPRAAVRSRNPAGSEGRRRPDPRQSAVLCDGDVARRSRHRPARRGARRPAHQDRGQSRIIPFSRGAASAFHQASILGPLRSGPLARSCARRASLPRWDEFAEFAQEAFHAERAGERVRFLSQTRQLPVSRSGQEHALSRFPQAKWIEYEPISEDQALAGAELAFGALRPAALPLRQSGRHPVA